MELQRTRDRVSDFGRAEFHSGFYSRRPPNRRIGRSIQQVNSTAIASLIVDLFANQHMSNV